MCARWMQADGPLAGMKANTNPLERVLREEVARLRQRDQEGSSPLDCDDLKLRIMDLQRAEQVIRDPKS
jgi:hypothetical protein